VELFSRDNAAFDEVRGMGRLRLLLSTLYALGVRSELRARLARERFDVVHVHNTVPLLTGAVYDALRGSGVRVVQHLHNYRFACPASYAWRRGRPCAACRRTAFLACVPYRCYRGSGAASLLLVAARWLDALRGRPLGAEAARWLAVSEAVRAQALKAGLAADRVVTVENPAEDLATLCRPVPPAQRPARLVFVGSLIAPKGVHRLLPLARALPEYEVVVIGTGAEEAALRAAAQREGLANMRWAGLQTGGAKAGLWAPAFLTLVPSEWDEPFGLVAAESAALGIPVLASAVGGLAGIVQDGRNGYRVDFGAPERVAELVRALRADGPRYEVLSRQVRQDYEQRYSEAVFAARLEAALGEGAAA
jgi:glycosyltransferase involved in cell wall biosynthesis